MAQGPSANPEKFSPPGPWGAAGPEWQQSVTTPADQVSPDFIASVTQLFAPALALTGFAAPFIASVTTVYAIQNVWSAGSTETYDSSTTWTCPPGVFYITVQAWGGGGAGGTVNPNPTAGGGGGGYSASTVPVTPGTTYTVTVGAAGVAPDGSGGDSSFTGDSSTTVLAKGGGGASGAGDRTAGPGGAAASGSGTIKFSGGSGGAGVANSLASGAGGGEAGGPEGNGNPGGGATANGGLPVAGGSGATSGGDGGQGGAYTGSGGTAPATSGSAPGGGGGGAGASGVNNGGSGASGRIQITYITLLLPFIGSSTNVYGPAVAGTVTVPFISSVSAVYAPAEIGNITPDFIASVTQVYTPQLPIPLGFISSVTTVYALAVQGDVDVPFISSVTVVYAPTVEHIEVDVPFIPSVSVVYALSITNEVDVPLLVATVTFYTPTLQNGIIDVPFISVGVVYALTLQGNTIYLPFIGSGTAVYAPGLQGDFIDVPFLASVTQLYPPYVQPDFILVPFIASVTVIYPIPAVWRPSTGPGNGGELFTIQLAPNGSTVTATLAASITASAGTLTLTGDGGLPSTGGFCLTIDSEVMLVTQTSAGHYTINQRGMSNTAKAAHTGGVTVSWTDTYNMALTALSTIPHTIVASDSVNGSHTYEAWLIVFDSSQAYLSGHRYPTYVKRIVGAFPAGTGITGPNALDAEQVSATHVPERIAEDCPSGMTIPARMIADVNTGDACVVRYVNKEASILTLGSRAVAIQSWYGFDRYTDADVLVTGTNYHGHVVDGTIQAAYRGATTTSATLPGSSRIFTYGSPRYSHKGWPIAALAIRNGHNRIPLWTSPTWHNFGYVYTGFNDDTTFVQILINRNDVVWNHLDPTVALPGSQDIDGPLATWDDPDDYYTSTSWYVAIFGTTAPALIIGPPVNTPPPVNPPPGPLPVYTPPGGSGGGSGGGVTEPPPSPPPEGGSGGNIPPPLGANFSGVLFEGII